jgi:hypothetical protein
LTGKRIVKVAAAFAHSVVMDITGEYIYAFGRCENAETGQGVPDRKSCHEPTIVKFPQIEGTDLPVKRVFRNIYAGGSISMAITLNGEIFSWGFGENQATGHAVVGDRDVYWARQLKLEDMVSVPGDCEKLEILGASIGVTHSMVLVKETASKKGSNA